jgi:hypothetical protein
MNSHYFWKNNSVAEDGWGELKNVPRNLMYTKRYSAFEFPKNLRRQSVAEHVFGCMSILSSLEDSVQKSLQDKTGFDVDSILQYLLFHHDDAEAVIGDIPAHIKNLDPSISDAEEKILDILNPSYSAMGKINPTLLAMVSCIDMLECLYYSVECARNNFVMIVVRDDKEEFLHEIALDATRSRVQKIHEISGDASLGNVINRLHVNKLAHIIQGFTFNEKTQYSRSNRKTESPKNIREFFECTKKASN